MNRTNNLGTKNIEMFSVSFDITNERSLVKIKLFILRDYI